MRITWIFMELIYKQSFKRNEMLLTVKIITNIVHIDNSNLIYKLTLLNFKAI